MCIQDKKRPKDKEKWLRKWSGQVLHAYKVVNVYSGRVYSMYANTCERFAIHNSISPTKKIISMGVSFEDTTAGDRQEYPGCPYFTMYKPYFHLFKKKDDAEDYADGDYNTLVLKFEGPRSAITDIGWQDGPVIVTKRFSFIGSRQYFRDFPEKKVWR